MVDFIDISKYQVNVDFSVVKDTSCKAVIMKATQGTSYEDPRFKERANDVVMNGLFLGAYHYGTNSDPISQANNFLATVADYLDCRFLCLDFERRSINDPNKMSLEQAEQFIDVVANKTGYYPVFYFGEYFKSLVSQVKEDSIIRQCTPWVAQYSSKITNFPTSIWAEPVMWQYSGSGKIDGIQEPVDLDYFLGSEESFNSIWI